MNKVIVISFEVLTGEFYKQLLHEINLINLWFIIIFCFNILIILLLYVILWKNIIDNNKNKSNKIKLMIKMIPLELFIKNKDLRLKLKDILNL